MNLNNNPTKDELRALLRPLDDRARHLLWVDHAGEVRVDPVPGSVGDFVRGRPDLRMWLRVFEPGHEYVGPGAAADKGWIEDVFRALNRQWPKAQSRTAVVAVEDW